MSSEQDPADVGGERGWTPAPAPHGWTAKPRVEKTPEQRKADFDRAVAAEKAKIAETGYCVTPAGRFYVRAARATGDMT